MKIPNKDVTRAVSSESTLSASDEMPEYELDQVSGGAIINSVTYRPGSGGGSAGGSGGGSTLAGIVQNAAAQIGQAQVVLSNVDNKVNGTAESIIRKIGG